VIGTTYGNADGSHFNVPDLRQRFPLGKAASGTGNNLGDTGGFINHSHTQPTHTHGVNATGQQSGGDALTNVALTGGASASKPVHTHTVPTSNAGGGDDTGTANPPYVVVNYIIKY
jgi:microcystin-dependent protein